MRHDQLKEAIAEGQYPFLAAAEIEDAFAVKVEWIEEEPTEDDKVSLVVKHNYCQIFVDSDLKKLLSHVERILESNHSPILDVRGASPLGFAGGARWYVPEGHPLRIKLKILRPLELIDWPSGKKWIFELSWTVTPA